MLEPFIRIDTCRVGATDARRNNSPAEASRGTPDLPGGRRSDSRRRGREGTRVDRSFMTLKVDGDRSDYDLIVTIYLLNHPNDPAMIGSSGRVDHSFPSVY